MSMALTANGMALNCARMLSLLGSDAADIQLQLVESIDSTNQHLLMLADQGAQNGLCLVAQQQTAGRGRQGRHWLSSADGSLTFSLLWRFKGGAAQLSGLSLAVSLGVARALETLQVEGVTLKWPNDLLRHGRKIAGVLVEISDGADGTVGAVIGIGLNVVLNEVLSDRLQNPATDLRSAAFLGVRPQARSDPSRGPNTGAPEREAVFASIVHELLPLLRQFAVSGFDPLKNEWMSRSIHQHRMIRLTHPDGRTSAGEVAGVDQDGALLLKQGSTIQRFLSGEVSLRVAS
jgi:BirA family biotin operon repressor/biotin-[acetyl-CoA-carboxylase] ligase